MLTLMAPKITTRLWRGLFPQQATGPINQGT